MGGDRTPHRPAACGSVATVTSSATSPRSSVRCHCGNGSTSSSSLALYRSGRQAEALRASMTRDGPSQTSLASTPAPGCATSNSGCSNRIRRSTGRHRAALRRRTPAKRRAGPRPPDRRRAPRRVACPWPCLPLIGRTAELARLDELLDGHRVADADRPGRRGKTRLAIDVAAAPEPARVLRRLRPDRRPVPGRADRRRAPSASRSAPGEDAVAPSPTPLDRTRRRCSSSTPASTSGRRRPAGLRGPAAGPGVGVAGHQPASARRLRRVRLAGAAPGPAPAGRRDRGRDHRPRRRRAVRRAGHRGATRPARSTTPPPPTSPRSAWRSTVSRWPSSSPPPAPKSSARPRSAPDSRTASTCSSTAAPTSPSVSRRCAPRSTGASSCCPRSSARSSPASARSPARSTSTPRSTVAGDGPRLPRSSCWRRW